jgi:hypothetical protein
MEDRLVPTGTFSFAQPTYVVAEGGSFDIVVKRAKDTSMNEDVFYRISPIGATPATPHQDFEAPDVGQIHFNIGDTEGRSHVTGTVTADNIPEPNETFKVDLFSMAGASLNQTATVIISDTPGASTPGGGTVAGLTATKVGGTKRIGGSKRFTQRVKIHNGGAATGPVRLVIGDLDTDHFKVTNANGTNPSEDPVINLGNMAAGADKVVTIKFKATGKGKPSFSLDVENA